MANSEPWPTTSDGYDVTCLIGKGAFAKVYQAKCPRKDKEVAVKILELDNLDTGLDDITQEVLVMKMSQHPNVLTSYSAFVVKASLWVIMPLMRKGSCLRIMSFMKKSGLGEGFKEDWIATILKATLEGLNYLHMQNQVHRDIKAGNILMDGDGTVVLSDFGVAGLLNQEADRRQKRGTFVGTPCWMAPEVMEQADGYDEKADIWSFGITALELAKGYAPYAKLQPMKVLLSTIKNPPPSLKSYSDYGATKNKFSRHFKEVVTLCLQKNPKLRPSCATLLGKSFFKKARAPSTLVKELLDEVPIPDTVESFNKAAVDEYAQENPGAMPFYSETGVSFAPGTTWTFDDESPQPSEGAPSGAPDDSAVQHTTKEEDDDFAAFEKEYAESMIKNEEGD